MLQQVCLYERLSGVDDGVGGKQNPVMENSSRPVLYLLRLRATRPAMSRFVGEHDETMRLSEKHVFVQHNADSSMSISVPQQSETVV